MNPGCAAFLSTRSFPILLSLESVLAMVRDMDAEDDDLEFEDSPATSRRRRAAKPSGFVNVMAIIDMVLGGMVLIGVPIQALQLLAASQQAGQGPIPVTVGPVNFVVLGVSAMLGVCSLVAGFFLLKGRSSALPFGWGAVALTLLSTLLGVVVAISTVNALASAMPDESARSVATAAGYGGMAVTTAMRLGLLALYATALVQFKKWLDRNG